MSNQILYDTYYNPRTGYINASQLYKKIKHTGITLKQVQEWLKKQESVQITHQKSQNSGGIPITGKPNSYQADLTFLTDLKAHNRGYTAILCIIEITSRKAYCYPIKTKTATEISKCIHEFLEDIDYQITYWTSDNGSEFKNKSVRKLLTDHQVNMQFADPNDKSRMGKVERFNRTIKTRIQKYFIANKSLNWIDVINDLVDNYNDTVHSRTKYSPNEVTVDIANEIRAKERTKGHAAIQRFHSFNIGDNVRLLNKRKVF